MQVSHILITNVVASIVLFLKCHHLNFQSLSEVKIKSVPRSFFPFFDKEIVFWQQFSTLSIVAIANVHQGTLCEWIDRAFHL